MKRKLKAQKAFEKLHFANCDTKNPKCRENHIAAQLEFASCLYVLALQGKLFVEQKDGITDKLRAVDPRQDCWLGDDGE